MMDDSDRVRLIQTAVSSCVPSDWYGEVTLHYQSGECHFVSVRRTYKPVGKGKWQIAT